MPHKTDFDSVSDSDSSEPDCVHCDTTKSAIDDDHCHVCNFLRCDSICYFNAQNVTLSVFTGLTGTEVVGKPRREKKVVGLLYRPPSTFLWCLANKLKSDASAARITGCLAVVGGGRGLQNCPV